MLIQQKRIRTLERHLPEQYRNHELRVGVSEVQHHRDRLLRSGFSDQLTVGERVLPSKIGPVSRYNAEGKHVIRRDLDKETAYRQVEWHWTEFHGDERVERSDFRDVPYLRYPRDFVPPPSVEFEIYTDLEGNKLVSTDPILYNDARRELLTHAINVCLEHFNECRIFTDDLSPIVKSPVRRLNWRILPKGRRPWGELRRELQPLIDQAKKGNRPVITHRLETINSYQPEFVGVGEAGFSGYVVFGFPTQDLYVFESARYGNATYVFEEDWEALSQMTKAQILDQRLQKQRIIHREGWPDAIQHLLG